MSAKSTPPLFMHMGCTNAVITYRAAGNEGVCLLSPQHGVQQLANFNPAIGDFIGVDDILELTTAHSNLSDVANYITSQVSAAGTTLYFDPTGTGKVGTPFAVIQGVSTTVAQLVADGGMKYVPDAITVTPAFETPLSLRPDGLETVQLRAVAPGIGPQQINNFNPALSDILQLQSILNKTGALPNLSNIASYISATTQNGNTTLSVDTTGHGAAGTPFAVLEGVTVTLSQLLADNALAFNPTPVSVIASPNMTFIYRPEGSENVTLRAVQTGISANQMQNFSLAANDSIDVVNILGHAGLQVDLANISNYFSTVETGGNTQLWFDPNGSGHGGTLEAVFQGSTFTLNDLLSHSAFNLS